VVDYTMKELLVINTAYNSVWNNSI